MKFRLKKDWFINDFLDKVKIYDKGHIFTPDESGNYHIKGVNESSHFMTFDNMLKAKSDDELLFEPVSDEELEVLSDKIWSEIENKSKVDEVEELIRGMGGLF